MHPVERFTDLISGKALWFMPCLIIAETLWFYIHNLSRSTFHIVILGVGTSAIGLGMSYLHILRYAMIDTAFVVQAFFVLGLLVKNYEQQLSSCWQKWLPLSGVGYFFVGGVILVLWPEQTLDVHLNKYFNVPICFFMIVVGCISLFVLFKTRNISPRWLVYIGQNTLAIYLLHGIILSGSNMVIKKLSINYLMSHPEVSGLVRTILACVFCCAFAAVANKYFPKLVGK